MPESQTRGKRQQRQPALLHIAPNAPSETCPSWWEGAVKKPIKVQPICQKASTTSLQLNPRQNRERVTRKWFDQRRVSEREQMFPPSDPLVIRLNQDSVTTSLFYGSRCFQIIAWELSWDAKVLECRGGWGGDNKEFPLVSILTIKHWPGCEIPPLWPTPQRTPYHIHYTLLYCHTSCNAVIIESVKG